MVNAHWEPLEFAVQAPGRWRRIVDTTLAAPEHVLAVADAPPVGATVTVADRSIVVLST
jgi:pullulanase/glycogen debranching enzyme